MAKEVLISEGQLRSWLRRGKFAVAGYVGLILLVGLAYIVAKLIGAEFGPLFIGLVATVAGCAVGAVAWGGLWLTRLVVLQSHQIERQRERLSLLEASLELREAEGETATVIAGAPALVAGHAPPVGFPRIAPATIERSGPVASDQTAFTGDKDHVPQSPPAPIVREQPANSADIASRAPSQPGPSERGQDAIDEALAARPEVRDPRLVFDAALAAEDLAAAQQVWPVVAARVASPQVDLLRARLDALMTDASARLRDDFARLVREQNFEAAMMKGDEIAELLPGSRMQAEYASLRPHLERRVHERRAAKA